MSREKTIAAVVVAAGSGTRAGTAHEIPKQFRAIAGTPLLRRTIDALLAHSSVTWVQPVIGSGHGPAYDALGSPHVGVVSQWYTPRGAETTTGDDRRCDC